MRNGKQPFWVSREQCAPISQDSSEQLKNRYTGKKYFSGIFFARPLNEAWSETYEARAYSYKKRSDTFMDPIASIVNLQLFYSLHTTIVCVPKREQRDLGYPFDRIHTPDFTSAWVPKAQWPVQYTEEWRSSTSHMTPSHSIDVSWRRMTDLVVNDQGWIL